MLKCQLYHHYHQQQQLRGLGNLFLLSDVMIHLTFLFLYKNSNSHFTGLSRGVDETEAVKSMVDTWHKPADACLLPSLCFPVSFQVHKEETGNIAEARSTFP